MDIENNTVLWVDKHNPNTIDELILDQTQKDFFNNIIKSKNISNIILCGPQGQGKTTIAELLCKQLNAVTLFIPQSSKYASYDDVTTGAPRYAVSMP